MVICILAEGVLGGVARDINSRYKRSDIGRKKQTMNRERQSRIGKAQ